MSPDDDRLAALERQVAALAAEVTLLRESRQAAPMAIPPPPPPRHDAFARASAVAHAIREDEIESLVGRYGTLLLAAFVMLMGVGVLIQFAVARGLLTPAVRVGIGAVVAAGVGAAGVYFHRRGDVRYGNVLLAIALALVDLVAWGAGPRLHLVPTGVALAVVDVAAVALAALALHDESEFLFCIAVAGALSSPFVTTDGFGTTVGLLGYGSAVLLGSLRAARDPRWHRAFVILVVGALVYALAAAALPSSDAWYSPFAVSLFGGVCAAGALLTASDEWRGSLSRAFLGVALVGAISGWDGVARASAAATWSVAFALAAVTQAALSIRTPRQPLWTASAVVLPTLSLAIATAAMTTARGRAETLALWAAISLVAWIGERRRGEGWRAGAHLLAAALLSTAAVTTSLWPSPLPLVASLAGLGVVVAWLSRNEVRPLPLFGVALPLTAAALSAIDQLASRQAYAYVPFATRSSASAFCAALGIAGAGLALRQGVGAHGRVADAAVRLGVLVGFGILWGRMEVATAWSPDVAAFLLIAYYAACGLASIVAGQRYAVSRLRLAGLALAVYAAVKAIAEASDIGGLLLRVGAYGAVGIFLLAAGYLYREAGSRPGRASAT